MNKQKTNGIAQLDDATERMRLQVVQLELRARYWKAQYEIKQYMLSDKELKDDYDKYMEEIMEQEKKNLEALQEQMKVNQDNGITVEPVVEGEINEPQEETHE